jgi:hypothetical protein
VITVVLTGMAAAIWWIEVRRPERDPRIAAPATPIPAPRESPNPQPSPAALAPKAQTKAVDDPGDLLAGLTAKVGPTAGAAALGAVKQGPADAGQMRVIRRHDVTGLVASVSRDSQTVLSGCRDGAFVLWELAGGAERARVQIKGWCLACALAPDGRHAILGNAHGVAALWDLVEQRELMPMPGAVVAEFSSDGAWALTGYRDHTLRLWDVRAAKELRVLEGHRGPIRGVAIAFDKRWLLSSDHAGHVILWDAERGMALRKLHQGGPAVPCVRFSPSARRALTTSDDHRIRVWDVLRGEMLHELHGHKAFVLSADFSPDGQWIASSASVQDPTVRVWDVLGAVQIAQWEDHTDAVYKTVFTDERHLLSASNDQTIRLWRLPLWDGPDAPRAWALRPRAAVTPQPAAAALSNSRAAQLAELDRLERRRQTTSATDWKLDNELRHLYAILGDEARSLHYCDAMFRYSQLDGYLVLILKGGSRTDFASGRKRLLDLARRYPQYRFLGAACRIAAGDLALAENDVAGARECFDVVAAIAGPEPELAGYRALARKRLGSP